jgi:hypothetical protein
MAMYRLAHRGKCRRSNHPDIHLPATTGGLPSKRRWVVSGAAAAVAVLIATAALTISLIGPGHDSTQPSGGAASTQSAKPTPNPEATEAADRALCNAIAPLVKENSARGMAFADLGDPGTPARDAGIDSFTQETLGWVKQIEAQLAEHMDASPFFTRTLQRYIDDRRIYATNLRPGLLGDADAAAWNDAKVALAGPFDICGNLGIPLW